MESVLHSNSARKAPPIASWWRANTGGSSVETGQPVIGEDEGSGILEESEIAMLRLGMCERVSAL